jgi:hypothetical protein
MQFHRTVKVTLLFGVPPFIFLVRMTNLSKRTKSKLKISETYFELGLCFCILYHLVKKAQDFSKLRSNSLRYRYIIPHRWRAFLCFFGAISFLSDFHLQHFTIVPAFVVDLLALLISYRKKDIAGLSDRPEETRISKRSYLFMLMCFLLPASLPDIQ